MSNPDDDNLMLSIFTTVNKIFAKGKQEGRGVG
jgi:hypothetical protein